MIADKNKQRQIKNNKYDSSLEKKIIESNFYFY